MAEQPHKQDLGGENRGISQKGKQHRPLTSWDSVTLRRQVEYTCCVGLSSVVRGAVSSDVLLEQMFSLS